MLYPNSPLYVILWDRLGRSNSLILSWKVRFAAPVKWPVSSGRTLCWHLELPALTKVRSYLYTSENCAGYIDPASTRILGSCTGLLAGVVASSSQRLSDLIDLGVLAVRIAFRIGVLVATLRDRLQPDLTGPESWSRVVTGFGKESMVGALDKFHAETVSIISKVRSF